MRDHRFGGVQEETTYLGIPCATLRENTERPVTVSEGTNRLLKPPELAAAARTALAGQWPRGRRPSHRQARRREPRQALALHGMRVRVGGSAYDRLNPIAATGHSRAARSRWRGVYDMLERFAP